MPRHGTIPLVSPPRRTATRLALAAPVALCLLAGCGFGDADGRPGARYFQINRNNAATAADLEAYLGVPVDHRTAINRMRSLGARCKTSEMLIRIDDSVLCRYATGTSFF